MSDQPIHLGVNIDHVATLRQARGTPYPRPVEAAVMVEVAGADSITVHLREDRRHIQDHDLVEIQEVMRTHMNLEMAVTDEMLDIAMQLKPSDVCLVPEKREELTTEGGLDVRSQKDKVRDAVAKLGEAGIRVSLFIDPEEGQLDAAVDVGAPVVEIHTGAYADAADKVVDYLKALQRVGTADPGVNGALAGSFPVTGGYMSWGYPNWATKYFLDALMLQENRRNAAS